MEAVNIEWDIDDDDLVEWLKSMNPAEAAKSLGVNFEKSDRFQCVSVNRYVANLKDPLKRAEIMGLPSEVEIPADIEEDEIADWLSDEYGFCVVGYSLEKDLRDFDKG